MKPTHNPVTLLKDLAGLGLYYPGQAALNRLPRSTIEGIARVGAGLVRRLAGSTEMQDELRRIYAAGPEMPRTEAGILQDALRLTMYNELEVLRYPYLNPKTINQVCEIEGRDHLDRARVKGKGAIVLIGHFGANQMIMPALGHIGYTMSQLSAPPPVWAEILKETRTTPLWKKTLERRWEMEKLLPVQHINVFRFLRPAFDCLHRNEVLGLAFDGGGGQKWETVDFLGRRANFSLQPVQIWKKTGAALLPTVVLRMPGESRHKVIIGEELAWQGSPKAGLQAIAKVFEPWVWAHPEHYLHFLQMRRRVRGTDVFPMFDDYPPVEGGGMSPQQAEEHLKRAGSWTER
ncbi:MAG: lauroyl acyltransferase [Myxococcales bacterium]|nr:lauroyl acyltransferase [Myxococcales bacterium]